MPNAQWAQSHVYTLEGIRARASESSRRVRVTHMTHYEIESPNAQKRRRTEAGAECVCSAEHQYASGIEMQTASWCRQLPHLTYSTIFWAKFIASAENKLFSPEFKIIRHRNYSTRHQNSSCVGQT